MGPYYHIMNILDNHAIANKPLERGFKIKLDRLLKLCNVTIEDIADANDCEADNWDDLVAQLRDLFEAGERISIEADYNQKWEAMEKGL